MKNIYWRPRGIPRTALVLIAILALSGLAAVEIFQTRQIQPHFREKIRASRLAYEAMTVLKQERINRRVPIDPDADPIESGMVGELMSSVTSNTGVLSAKQTAVNPNFAGVVVHLLKRADVQEGDYVGVGFSGSFPAINVCVLAALETLKVQPIIISSASASSWGANIEKFLWIDMENTLYKKNLISFRSIAASVGGVEDRGLGMSDRGIRLLKRAIDKNDLVFIDPVDYAASVEQRMAIYREKSGGEILKAYINVGGGTTSVGTKVGKRLFRPGLNRRAPIGGAYMDSVMSRMVSEGVPVLHFVRIATLAKRYGLPVQPVKMPRVGEGKIFYKAEYNKWLATGVLVGILLIVYIFVRSDWGYKIMFGARQKKGKKQPEPMV